MQLSAQVTIQPAQLDFGVTGPDTEWIVDIVIINRSGKKDFLLRHTFSHEYEVLFTSKTLLPDSSITMRVKFVPRLKGSFNEKIELYFAGMQTPVVFPVRATVVELNGQANIPCPDFSRLAADCCASNGCSVEVRDAVTKKPIQDADVVISEQQVTRLRFRTGKEGRVTFEIPISFYDISASAKGYNPESIRSYINRRNADFVFYLEANTQLPVEESVSTPIAEPVPYDSTFSLARFKPNNIVFLIDISGSMAQSNKLELTKSALNELVAMLRKDDLITVITYADQPKILLDCLTGDIKSELYAGVSGISAGGNTNASAAFDLAFKKLRENQLTDGNNQLFVVTDGAFRPEDQKRIFKLTNRYKRKGFITSVVGIKSTSFAQNALGMVSETGNGSFLQINTEVDLQVLKSELKQRSAR